MTPLQVLWLWLTVPGAVIWCSVLLLPWLPWLNREVLEPSKIDLDLNPDLSDVTVLVPARDEAAVIAATLASLQQQGQELRVLVIDDQSSDSTADVARQAGAEVLSGEPLPDGWTGKLWALDQGLHQVQTSLTLLLDADIELKPGLLSALLQLKRERGAQFVSLMADLPRHSFWDRLLIPAFVYFFKLLYPFAISNSRSRWVAAAAGGCVLVDTGALRGIGAFESLRGALIDDCTLARRIKDGGHRTWIGLSRGVVSSRLYGTLGSIHAMVVRSAFTQLRYSFLWLLTVTALFIFAYWLPLAGLVLAPEPARRWAFGALLAMMVGYIPTLHYYRVSPYLALLLPLTGTLYLGMTWSSALRYWLGTRSSWKGRSYAR